MTPTFRNEVLPGDVGSVHTLVTSTNFFSPAEVAIAAELVAERLRRGVESGYEFLFAEDSSPPHSIIGYACFGEIPCTVNNYDLYWIAVDPTKHRHGLGSLLLAQVESKVRQLGGRQIYVDTAGREQYLPTRRFYERNGYTCAAVLPHFYAPGDAKHIFAKTL